MRAAGYEPVGRWTTDLDDLAVDNGAVIRSFRRRKP